MKAIRHFRFGKWMLIAAGLIVVTVSGVSVIRAANPSSDEFCKQYDLPKDPKTVLKDILARGEFKSQDESWISRVRRVITETITRILKWIFDHLPSIGPIDIDRSIGELALDVQLIVFLGLIASLAVWVMMRLVVARRRRTQVILPHEDHIPARSYGSDEARLMALRMAEQGDYRAALIHLFRYCLIRLDEKGRLAAGPGKTNREVLDSLPLEEPLRAPLAEMIPLFDRVRYGDADCGQADFKRFETLCQQAIERT